MSNIFKRFAAWATRLKADNFGLAVVRLTAYYTAGVFCILVAFSALVYFLFSANIEATLEERNEQGEALIAFGDESPLHEVAENLLNILIFSDIVLLFLTVCVSYLLARKTLAPLLESYQKQKRFVADAAHEIRTPLSVLKAGSELLLRQERSVTEYKHFLVESQDEIDRLTTLSNDLLHLALSSETQVFNKERFSLSEICLMQCERIIPYASQNDVTVRRQISNDVTMEGIRDDIARLILNMLKNAIDYNTKGGVVTLTLARENSNIVLTIADTGIGIAAKDIPHIFDRFYKADTARVQKEVTGSGLGLSIVKEILARHNGKVEVQSILQKGTTFTFRFPAV